MGMQELNGCSVKCLSAEPGQVFVPPPHGASQEMGLNALLFLALSKKKELLNTSKYPYLENPRVTIS